MITDPDGNTVEVTTDAEGHAVSSQLMRNMLVKNSRLKRRLLQKVTN